MDINVLVGVLANTFSENPELRKPAEEQLKKVGFLNRFTLTYTYNSMLFLIVGEQIEKEVPGYHACLLQLITIADIPLPIRQVRSSSYAASLALS
jgi:hypothetical protein